MIRNILTHMTDVQVYPIIALVLFTLVFAGAIIWAATMKRSEAAALGRLPLEDSKPAEEGDHRHE